MLDNRLEAIRHHSNALDVWADIAYAIGRLQDRWRDARGHRRGAEPRHVVSCPHCAVRFDLFAARWCEHLESEASKTCPACSRCVCDHPGYAEPHLWVRAPVAFERRGFRRLFLLYL